MGLSGRGESKKVEINWNVNTDYIKKKDLNSPRKLSAEAEKELALVERKLQDTHLDHIDLKMAYILVILPSTISPTGILMQREDYIFD